LTAGPIETLVADGELRYLRVAGVEVLRRVYGAVRDTAWGTVPGVVSNCEIENRADGFSVQFVSTHQANEIDFVWRGRIEAKFTTRGDAIDADIVFSMDGEAHSTFLTNRVGLCVLHPLSCAGRPCLVRRSDGGEARREFPTLIAPHQPFGDFRGLRYEPAPRLSMDVAFDGEAFETEDQRNWTDGSFKTYSRPLSWAFPYEMKRGQRVRQSITVRLAGSPSATDASRRNAVVLGPPAGALPPIGVRWAAGRHPPTDGERSALVALKPAHLRVDFHLGREEADIPWRAIPADWNVPLELAVHLPRDGAAGLTRGWPALRSFVQESTGRLARIIVYREGKPFVAADDVAAIERTFAPVGALVGGGTIGAFAELSRHRADATAMRLLSYPINPQVHATDDLSIIENLEGQADTVRTARSFASAAHVAVSPLFLHRRPDPFAAGKSGTEELARPDPRQRIAFAAAWTVASIRRLAEAGVDSLTCYEAVGPFGLMGGGEMFPVYDVLRQINEMAGGVVWRSAPTDPLRFDALAIETDGALRVLAANLTDEPIDLTLEGSPGGPGTVTLRAYEVFVSDHALAERR
jgi:hypothetical protein